MSSEWGYERRAIGERVRTTANPRPVVTRSACLAVLKRARHTALYSHQHYLVVDALIEGVLYGARRVMTRTELLTLYRCIGYVHLACHKRKMHTTIDALERTLEWLGATNE